MGMNSALLLLHSSLSGTLLFPVHRRRLCPHEAQKLLPVVPTRSNSSSSLQMVFSSNHQFSISGPSSLFSPMALPSDASVDTDDMFDDLFKKHGKVVFRRSDQKSSAAEIDDDTESLSFAVAVAVAAAKVASEVEAADIKVLFVKSRVLDSVFHYCHCIFSASD